MSQLNILELSKYVSQNWLHFQKMVANYDYNTDNDEKLFHPLFAFKMETFSQNNVFHLF